MYKAIEIAKWFLQYNALEQKLYDDVEGISNLKLQKLLYYAQGCYLALYNKPLFAENIVAWQHGPVVVEVYDRYKKFHANSITELEEAPTIDDETLQVLKWVYDEFGKYTAWALRNKTHEETPWRVTTSNEVILNSVIRDYFIKNYVEA